MPCIFNSAWQNSVKPIRFSQSARKHRIGKGHVYSVIATAPVEVTTDPVTGREGLIWVGPDDRGVTLTVLLLELADCFLVIHVQPAYRRRNR